MRSAPSEAVDEPVTAHNNNKAAEVDGKYGPGEESLQDSLTLKQNSSLNARKNAKKSYNYMIITLQRS